jgi:hypothetical protein
MPDCISCRGDCEKDGWCKGCEAEGLVANFGNWTSGDSDIDAFIQNTQEGARYREEYLEWINPEQIIDIEHIANGGCGSVYQATWTNAPERFVRSGFISDGKVALKITTSEITTFLNEVIKQTSLSNVNNRLLINRRHVYAFYI